MDYELGKNKLAELDIPLIIISGDEDRHFFPFQGASWDAVGRIESSYVQRIPNPLCGAR